MRWYNRWGLKGQLDMAFGVTLVLILLVGVGCAGQSPAPDEATAGQAGTTEAEATDAIWSQAELAMLRSLWIDSLPPLPPDPSNAVGDDPQAAMLGYQIFFDKRFSANGEVSCATCHKPEQHFTDGLARAEAIGKTDRSTPTILGVAYSPWFFWDGRRDSQWSQALTPLESSVEHGGTRAQYAHLLADDPAYREAYEAIFGPLPDLSDAGRFPASAGPFGDETAQAAWEGMALEDQQVVSQIYANLGKAIAAYERLIIPGPARFDTYVEAVLNGDVELAQQIFTPQETAGLKLFITDQAQCIRCHNGPLFTSHSFHNVGVPTALGLTLDYGRLNGAQEVLTNEFNCLGPYSDAGPDDCAELRFIKTNGVELPGAFKVPTLRNVAETAPYMQSGQFATLPEVLQHYSKADPGPLGHNELNPLNLTDQEKAELEAFLKTLSSAPATDPKWLSPPP